MSNLSNCHTQNFQIVKLIPHVWTSPILWWLYQTVSSRNFLVPIPHFFRGASQRFITCISDRPTTTPHSKPALESRHFQPKSRHLWMESEKNHINVAKSTYFILRSELQVSHPNLSHLRLVQKNRWIELENQTCLGRDIDTSGLGKQHSGFLSISFSVCLFFVNVGVLVWCFVFTCGFHLRNKRKETTTKKNKPTEKKRPHKCPNHQQKRAKQITFPSLSNHTQNSA